MAIVPTPSTPQSVEHVDDASVASSLTLSVILPVFNEAPTLLEIIRRVKAAPYVGQLVIVDDYSTDGTREILKSQVEGSIDGVIALYHERNRGKGFAIRTAIPSCIGDLIVIQDADLEYDPEDFAKLVAPVIEQGAKVVYGSRFLAGAPPMRLPNRVVNWLLATMVRVLYRAPMTDEATCYKLFSRDVLADMKLECERFEFCPEVTAKVLRRGFQIIEVPIRYTPRTHAEGKKIRWTDGIDAIWTLLKYRFRS